MAEDENIYNFFLSSNNNPPHPQDPTFQSSLGISFSKIRYSQCFIFQQLLFLGDSTNRGIMHYIMERLNGSLSISDKTHHIRVYSELNNGNTTLSFAYYPQFWLQAPQRPVFDKALYNLLLRYVQDNSYVTICFAFPNFDSFIKFLLTFVMNHVIPIDQQSMFLYLYMFQYLFLPHFFTYKHFVINTILLFLFLPFCSSECSGDFFVIL